MDREPDTGYTWILNGPTFTALNEINHDNVKIRHIEFKTGLTQKSIKDDESLENVFIFKFEPHSLTAIKLTK